MIAIHSSPFGIGQPVWLDHNYDLGLDPRWSYIVQDTFRSVFGDWIAVISCEMDLPGETHTIACRYLLPDPPCQYPALGHEGDIYTTATGTWLKLIVNPLVAQ